MTARGALAGLALASALACQPRLFGGHREVSGVWRLVPAESAIQFVGIKNNVVGVPGSFATVEGAYDSAKRTGFVEVKLGSTETGNPERDENVRTHFFETVKYPVARFDVTALPAPGASERIELTGTLSLHGATLPLKFPARVSRDLQNHLHLRNAAPLVLSAHDLGMDAQLAALKAVCGHESLSGAIPVEVDVAFAPVAAD